MTTKKKADAAPADKKAGNQPMDPSTREVLIGTPQVNRQRVCWAAKTLVAEVENLFPETPVEFSNYNGRNTALDVAFDLSSLDQEERDALAILLDITEGDHRISAVLIEPGGDQLLVSFKPNATTQDDRSPFGLADTLLVLNEDDDQ